MGDKRIPLIIDTDPGIDDAAALSLALFSPAVDVRLIATVAGNVGIEKTTRNALRLESFMGTDVPVARGAAGPLAGSAIVADAVHGKSGLGNWGYEGEATELLIDTPAAQAIWDELLACEAEGCKATILTLGPLTNIAILLREHPDLADHVECLVGMGAGITHGNVGPLAEFNIAADPLAAREVVESALDVTFVPLEVADNALLSPADLGELASASRTGAAVAEMMDAYASSTELAGGKQVYDPTAFCYVVEPQMFQVATCHLDVTTEPGEDWGGTHFDLEGSRGLLANVHVATGVDADAFRRWFLDGFRLCS